MDEVVVLRKIVKKMMLDKRGLNLDPKTIARGIPNEAKNLGIPVKDFRAVMMPIIGEIFDEAKAALLGNKK
jgi:hypothetical protein